MENSGPACALPPTAARGGRFARIQMTPLPYPEAVVNGLFLPECPRWRDGALYFSDITRGRLHRMQPGHPPEIVFETAEDYVAGLGFLADGGLLAVLSKSRRVIRVGPSAAAGHADLSGLCRFVLNDMITVGDRAYVTQPGRDVWAGAHKGMPEPTDLLMVDVDGSARVAARDMMGPNGVAVSVDGRTLYVAESAALRITCFSIDVATGDLSDRRVFATLPNGAAPDGICLDSEGAVWVASPVAVGASGVTSGPGVLRITPGGEATHRVPMQPGRRALACTFGGPGRSTLYICTTPDFSGAAAESAGEGRIEQVTLDFVGAGAP
jgi:sugar lactone lactonase YvrE